jgi:hypothetical protein
LDFFGKVLNEVRIERVGRLNVLHRLTLSLLSNTSLLRGNEPFPAFACLCITIPFFETYILLG